jgi:hypothetical protein
MWMVMSSSDSWLDDQDSPSCSFDQGDQSDHFVNSTSGFVTFTGTFGLHTNTTIVLNGTLQIVKNYTSHNVITDTTDTTITTITTDTTTNTATTTTTTTTTNTNTTTNGTSISYYIGGEYLYSGYIGLSIGDIILSNGDVFYGNMTLFGTFRLFGNLSVNNNKFEFSTKQTLTNGTYLFNGTVSIEGNSNYDLFVGYCSSSSYFFNSINLMLCVVICILSIMSIVISW